MKLIIKDSKDIFDLWRMAQKYNCDDFHNMLHGKHEMPPYSDDMPNNNNLGADGIVMIEEIE
jgi:hypothetical protein